MELYPTVFIDRDGTINFDAGYINHPDSFVMYPFAPQAIRMLNIHGFLTIIITNQSGLARGFFTEEVLNNIHSKMYDIFQKNGAKIDKLYYCPHDPNAKIEKYKQKCNCRKPMTGMIEQAFSEMPINKSRTYFIGDKYSDIQTGYKSGCKTIMVKTGYGNGETLYSLNKWEIKPDSICDNLLDAVKIILANEI